MHGSGKLRQLSLAMLLSICQHFDIYVESIKGRRKVPYLSLLREFLESCDRPLSQGGHFESQENKDLCFCTSTLALDERLDVQNLLFQHCVIKVFCHHSPCLWHLFQYGLYRVVSKHYDVTRCNKYIVISSICEKRFLNIVTPSYRYHTRRNATMHVDDKGRHTRWDCSPCD